jgi:hypothetical protein
LEATDLGVCTTDLDIVRVTIVDTTTPSIACPASITVECSAHGGAPATDPAIAAFLGGASATDVCDPALSISNDAPGFFPLGTTTVTFSTSDDAGNLASCLANVTVEDTTPPEISSDFTATPAMLWPPNHSLTPISIPAVTIHDDCDADPRLFCSVTSDEAPEGRGDGHTPSDISINGVPVFSQGTGEFEVETTAGVALLSIELRAERDGRQDGRRYIITCAPEDMSGNRGVSKSTVVEVPHDQGSN